MNSAHFSTRTASWVARALLAAFFIALVLIVLLPSDGHRVLGFVGTLAELVSRAGVPYTVAFTFIEFTANIALFVPLGVLLPLALQPHVTMPVLGTGAVGLGISIAIELGQLGIPGRVSSVFDVLANTAGTLIGAVACAAVLRFIRSGSSRSELDHVA